jgi:ribosomal protein L37E
MSQTKQDVEVESAPRLDHLPEPEWDTSTAYDFCLTCGWPVERLASGDWAHERRNPCPWTDRRDAVVTDADRDQQMREASDLMDREHPVRLTWEALGTRRYCTSCGVPAPCAARREVFDAIQRLPLRKPEAPDDHR